MVQVVRLAPPYLYILGGKIGVGGKKVAISFLFLDYYVYICIARTK
jgi:hypothetical protein